MTEKFTHFFPVHVNVRILGIPAFFSASVEGLNYPVLTFLIIFIDVLAINLHRLHVHLDEIRPELALSVGNDVVDSAENLRVRLLDH